MIIRSALRAVSLLHHVAHAAGGETSLMQASGALDLAPSTAHHLLGTLMAAGYIRQDPRTRRYGLGTRAVELAATVLAQVDVLREARRVMTAFALETSEAIALTVRDAHEAVCLHRVEPGGTPDSSLPGARRLPLHCAAAGKVLLAALPDTEVLEVLRASGMPQLTPKTRTDPLHLTGELAQVRTHGYGVEDGEVQAGMRSVAAPVHDHTGAVVAALSCSGRDDRLTGGRWQDVTRALVAAAAQLSGRLGWMPVAATR